MAEPRGDATDRTKAQAQLWWQAWKTLSNHARSKQTGTLARRKQGFRGHSGAVVDGQVGNLLLRYRLLDLGCGGIDESLLPIEFPSRL
jgi:hypothetical protein